MTKKQAPRRNSILSSLAITITQRIIFGVLIILVIIYLSHFGLSMARGESFFMAFVEGAEKTISSAGNILGGDLGKTKAGSDTLVPVPVSEVMRETITRSMGLILISLMFATILGIVLGSWSAFRNQKNLSLPILIASIIGISLPSFLVALLLQMLVIKITQTTGTTFLPVGGFGWDQRIVLPALALTARPLAQITRVTFITISNEIEQDYVRTAHSKGMPINKVYLIHIMRNALIPILTTIVVSLRFALSSLPIVESFFSWNGAGYMLLRSISQYDDALTIALVVFFGLIFIFVNLILDLLYKAIDPRLRQTLDYIAVQEQTSIAGWIKSMWADLQHLLANNRIQRWIAKKNLSEKSSLPAKEPPANQPDQDKDIGSAQDKAWEIRVWLRGTLGNPQLIFGSLLVLSLLIVLLFGPILAPHSPFTTRGLIYAEGEFSVPPFPPGQTHPWGTDVLGRDIQSLIFAGAQQTLTLTILVTFARLMVGSVLGALAGWFSGSKLDRLLLGLVEVIAAFPTLLLAMVLIIGLGIRQGFGPFVIALCFVGWGEIMQFVRAEVISIRPELFIESAVALGHRPFQIVKRHVLPNLIPALVSITALETGAVLMILGELGFIGIFIGGGQFAQFEMYRPFFHYSDIPEWGALLSNTRLYGRAYPWTALYPSLAFFFSILGFNLFGEGVRRLVDTVGVRVAKLVNRYSITLVAVSIAAFIWYRGSTGALAFYRQQAANFNGQNAFQHMITLTSERMEGRAIGSSGLDLAAEYIAQQFKAYGIQPAGEKLTYFQTRERTFVTLDGVPAMSVDDGFPDLIYRQDFVEYEHSVPLSADAHGSISVVMFNQLISTSWSGYPTLERLDLSGKIVIVLSEREFWLLERSQVPVEGILVVADEAAKLDDINTLYLQAPDTYTSTGFLRENPTSVMWITEELANRLLFDIGTDVDRLRDTWENLELDQIEEVPTNHAASLSIKSTEHQGVETQHVIGYLPGKAAIPGETKMDDELIIILAQYDSPPVGANGETYQFANDNASGIAVMLELIRNMQETGYQPYRTFLFVAYSGEGKEGGEFYFPQIARFLQSKVGFSTAYTPVAIIELRGLGAGQGDGILLHTGGSARLVDLFEDAAQRMGVASRRGEQGLDLSAIFSPPASSITLSLYGEERKAEAPLIGLSWDGWEETACLPVDTLDTIVEENLDNAGEVLSLALMVMGREIQY